MTDPLTTCVAGFFAIGGGFVVAAVTPLGALWVIDRVSRGERWAPAERSIDRLVARHTSWRSMLALSSAATLFASPNRAAAIAALAFAAALVALSIAHLVTWARARSRLAAEAAAAIDRSAALLDPTSAPLSTAYRKAARRATNTSQPLDNEGDDAHARARRTTRALLRLVAIDLAASTVALWVVARHFAGAKAFP